MYWDASALVTLFVVEPGSESVRTWLSEDDRIITWVWTRTEIVSAIERRTREGSLSRRQRRNVLERFNAFADSWDEVTDVLAVRARANALLGRHPLRAADGGPSRRRASGPRTSVSSTHVRLSGPATFVRGEIGEPSRDFVDRACLF